MKYKPPAVDAVDPADPGNELLPCRYCQEPTKRKVLSLLGARCQRCYEAYCRPSVAEFNAGFVRGKRSPRK